MDAPAVPEPDHHRALASLQAINQLSLTASTFLGPILQLANDLGRSHLSLLDVACGGGDVPLQLARLARRRGITLDVTLADRNPTALRHAAAKRPDGQVTTCQLDALDDRLPMADIVTNSLFLHHLDALEVTAALRHFASRACQLLLISDLRRCRMGWAIAMATCHVISRSPIVHHDGPASVRAAWTLPELRDLAARAVMPPGTISVRKVWPWRLLLTWRRP